MWSSRTVFLPDGTATQDVEIVFGASGTMGLVMKPLTVLVSAPASAPHHGPIVMATTAVPIMSKKVGSLSVVLM